MHNPSLSSGTPGDSARSGDLSLDLREALSDHRWLSQLCRRLLSPAEDADDLAQETALRAVLAKGAMPQRGWRAWLTGAARHGARQVQRSDRHRRDQETRFGEEAEREKSSLDPADALARAEFRERLAKLVSGLPNPEREALVLRFYEGLGYKEMTEATGASGSALRQRVSRGVARLR
ncbi:MAG: RNA polymerase sigma factor, partial [Planctomycetota bacterium]